MRAIGMSAMSICSSRRRCSSRSSGPAKASSWTTNPGSAPNAVVGGAADAVIPDKYRLEEAQAVGGNQAEEPGADPVSRDQKHVEDAGQQEQQREQKQKPEPLQR